MEKKPKAQSEQTQTTGNYSYTPPAQTPQPQVVYVNQPKQKNWWKYLLGCGAVLFICSCICVVPTLFLASLSATVGESLTNNASKNIHQTTILTDGDNTSEKAQIAVINITGAIDYSTPGQDFQSGAFSDNIIAQLQKAKDDSSVKAVLLRFNSPGGAVVAAEPICKEIKEVNKSKPVYSFIDSMGASLGYLLPNCSQYIYSRPEAITGSIGVILQAIDFYGVLEKLGGKVVFVTNTEGKQKSGEDIFDPNSETYKTYQKILDETYEYFITRVYEGRKLNNPSVTKEELKKYADGRIFSGNQAKELKLVDELGQFEEVISSMIKKENDLKGKYVEVVEYSLPIDPFSQLFMGANSALRSTDLKSNLEKNAGIKVMMQADLVGTTNSK